MILVQYVQRVFIHINIFCHRWRGDKIGFYNNEKPDKKIDTQIVIKQWHGNEEGFAKSVKTHPKINTIAEKFVLDYESTSLYIDK